MNYHSLRRGILPAESLPRRQAGTSKASGLLERL